MRDLSLHIIDLVQNCVEAGAKKVCLTLEEDLLHDRLVITVEDDGRGMDQEMLAKVKSPFVTSRKTRDVGLGIPLIDMSTKSAGGELIITSEPGKGTKVVASYRHSHIDRPPLGDIVTTVKIIAISYQNISFHYEHRKNSAVFILDTDEMREILGCDADFSAGEIRDWLDEYLREGLAGLDKNGGKDT